ncbi:hypothetical protein N5F23_07765 [Pseudomonas sichuanensis]|uniref:hypothetical protein n=1 Tax=Pseudomonas sichuanensis TaxID=2213015 RepID=UPI00244D1540|nr:hypothetical protein [Pseudomonas sichuanensis]MDH0729790.1 hypothetical protein [Pseudomonas sichuanensis]MDH1582488.1 hypothetical protein [Pseudomonas sichuanensis]MDH1593945.1 hypothetical protein [Pseudomonas sichuanensis]MDH1597481.1 hypothetical protein [Pseudomonas sichuanensis]
MGGQLKAGLTGALGIGLSGSVAVNSRSGMGATATYQTSTIAAPATASCGLRIAGPNAKQLPVALGGAVGLGLLNIEATQTSTYPEIYIGLGPGVGPEIKASLNLSLNVAYCGFCMRDGIDISRKLLFAFCMLMLFLTIVHMAIYAKREKIDFNTVGGLFEVYRRAFAREHKMLFWVVLIGVYGNTLVLLFSFGLYYWSSLRGVSSS